MTTLTVLKARIADEMARSDIPDLIANSISSAIAYYQRKRFYFNELDSVTFSTVDTQAEYTSSDNAYIPYLYDIDAITVTVSSNNYEMDQISPEEWRILYNTTATGQPECFAYFNQKLRLYPIPNDVWTVRIQAHVRIVAPATDGEASNVWMIDAEELIRARAKYDLYCVLGDNKQASMANAWEQQALISLNALSNSMMKTGYITPMQF